MLFPGAALAATVVTWFTFLPSFIFILAGGPVIESTHGNLKFTAPLTGVTAAVVGVIASLALFFLVHIAQAKAGGIDWIALVIAAVAAAALLRYKAGVIPVIGACALAGLMLRLAGLA
jgi:chromate transporter